MLWIKPKWWNELVGLLRRNMLIGPLFLDDVTVVQNFL